MKSCPDDNKRHHECLAGASSKFQSVPNEIAGLWHFSLPLDFIQIDKNFHGFLLAEKETLPFG
jgi:hypothetical protein